MIFLHDKEKKYLLDWSYKYKGNVTKQYYTRFRNY